MQLQEALELTRQEILILRPMGQMTLQTQMFLRLFIVSR